MKPVDDWCREALALRRVALLILRMEKRQEGGHVNKEPRLRSEWWMRQAEAMQRKHEATHEEAP